ncbi:hypothetical protein ACFYP4_09160 [Streptomyces sp. NPDC005551]|uniref:hypothetical protein n=1 Tax=Streptomyces sp. NPDC005551 TaxID=3364725 RepID=UPI00367FCAC1
MGETGRVLDAADESPFADPRGGGRAPVLAERLQLPPGDALRGRFDLDVGRAVVVAGEPGQSRGGAHGDGLVAVAVVAGRRHLAGGLVEPQLGLAQIERGAGDVAADEPVALRVVEVLGGRLVGLGDLLQAALGVVVEVLGLPPTVRRSVLPALS